MQRCLPVSNCIENSCSFSFNQINVILLIDTFLKCPEQKEVYIYIVYSSVTFSYNNLVGKSMNKERQEGEDGGEQKDSKRIFDFTSPCVSW